MERWEYLHVTFTTSSSQPGVATVEYIARWMEGATHKSEQGSPNAIMDKLGNEGWELVGFGMPLSANSAVFKRRKA